MKLNLKLDAMAGATWHLVGAYVNNLICLILLVKLFSLNTINMEWFQNVSWDCTSEKKSLCYVLAIGLKP